MTTAAWFRTIVGFLVAPISPGVLVVVVAVLLGFGSDAFATRGLAGAAWIVGLSAVLGYPVAFALGLPLYILFRWCGWNGLPIYVAAGAFLGFVVYLVYAVARLLGDESINGLANLAAKLLTTSPQLIPAGIISGAVAALSFWLIARPDRASL
jgi:hypothetical protein